MLPSPVVLDGLAGCKDKLAVWKSVAQLLSAKIEVVVKSDVSYVVKDEELTLRQDDNIRELSIRH